MYVWPSFIQITFQSTIYFILNFRVPLFRSHTFFSALSVHDCKQKTRTFCGTQPSWSFYSAPYKDLFTTKQQWVILVPTCNNNLLVSSCSLDCLQVNLDIIITLRTVPFIFYYNIQSQAFKIPYSPWHLTPVSCCIHNLKLHSSLTVDKPQSPLSGRSLHRCKWLTNPSCWSTGRSPNVQSCSYSW